MSSPKFDFKCAKCGTVLEMPLEDYGAWVECPSCKQKTFARSDNPNVHRPESGSEKKSDNRNPAIIERAQGYWPVFFVAAILSFFIYPVIGITLTAVVFALFFLIRLRCSSCGNRIHGKAVSMCPVCRCKFS